MPRSLTELAEKLDEAAGAGRAVLTETDVLLAAGRLAAEDAVTFGAGFRNLGWHYEIEDAVGDAATLSDLSDDFAPFKILAQKPISAPGSASIVTNTAFRAWLLDRPTGINLLHVARLDSRFDTFRVRFSPWEDETSLPFVPEALDADPSRVVRETGMHQAAPSDMSAWLLKPGEAPSWEDPAARVWIDAAAIAIFSALSNEIEGGQILVFRGPPTVRFQRPASVMGEMDPKLFEDLQRTGRWAFESDREMEVRQALVAAELSRTNTGNQDAIALFKAGIAAALEGAKIAYQLGLSKLSTDALKAMADLRKAVGDEAAKLADMTRQLATAVAGALFVGVGVIAARLTAPISSDLILIAIAVFGVLVCMYMVAVIAAGWEFMLIQRQLRADWKGKLYRFLPSADYEVMVNAPSIRAERAFKVAAFVSGGLTLLLLIAVGLASMASVGGRPMTSPSRITVNLTAQPTAPVTPPTPPPVGR